MKNSEILLERIKIISIIIIDLSRDNSDNCCSGCCDSVCGFKTPLICYTHRNHISPKHLNLFLEIV